MRCIFSHWFWGSSSLASDMWFCWTGLGSWERGERLWAGTDALGAQHADLKCFGGSEVRGWLDSPAALIDHLIHPLKVFHWLSFPCKCKFKLLGKAHTKEYSTQDGHGGDSQGQCFASLGGRVLELSEMFSSQSRSEKTMRREWAPHQSYCSPLSHFIKLLSITPHTVNFSQLWTFEHVISSVSNQQAPTYPSKSSSNVTCSVQLSPTSQCSLFLSFVFPQHFVPLSWNILFI